MVDTEVMFEIGVAEHPATKTRLEALAKSVLDAQSQMTMGVERVGLAAQASFANIGSLTGQIKEFRNSAVESYDNVREAIARVQSIASNRSRFVIDTVVQGAERASQPSSRPLETREVVPATNSAEDAAKQATKAVEHLQNVAAKPIEIDISLPSNLQNVFKELGDVSEVEAQRTEQAFENAVGQLPSNFVAQTALIKQEYEKRVLAASAAYAEMAEDLDGYLAREGSVQDKIQANMRKGSQVVTDAKEQVSEATERLNSSVVKGVRSVIGATKGFAELGLMSEQNTQKMLQGLVAIQGAFDIIDGAVDLLESFSMGWKAVRQSTEAASNVAKTQQALMGPQFAQLRAYQAQLVLEAQTANAAALANNRLAMSRGAKGGVASSVIDLAAGNVGRQAAVTAGGAVASRAVGSAAGGVVASGVGAAVGGGAVVGAGQMAVGGVAVGILGTLAAAGAALASLGLVATELTEIFRGTSTKANSVTGSIASFEASTAANALSMTGLFNSIESPGTKLAQSSTKSIDGFIESIPILGKFKDQINFAGGAIGDYAGLAASNAALAKAERNRAKTAIMAELDDKNSTGKTVALVAGRMAGLDRDSSVQRNNASFNGGVSGVSMAESRTQTDTAAKLEAMQKIINQFQMGDNNDFSEYTRAVTKATTLQADIINSISRQGTAVADSFNDNLQAERITQAAAYKAIEELTAIKAANIDVGEEGDKRRQEAVRAIRTLEDGIVASKEKQRSLVEEQSRVALDTQSKIQDSLRSQIALQETSMDRLTSGYKNAAQNFAKLGAIEKERAIAALEFARANGPGALKDEQKDALRSVGTEEAMRFANEGDAAEAKKFGFNQTFGSNEATERASIEQTQKTLKAQLSASYNVSAKLDFDSNAVVKSIVDTVNPLLESKYQEIQEGVQRQLATFKQTTQQAARDQLKAVKGQNGAAR